MKRLGILFVLAVLMSGCGAGNTLLHKSELQAQVFLTNSIFLQLTESGSGAKPDVFVEVRNTTNTPLGTVEGVSLDDMLKHQISNRGFTVVDSHSEAERILSLVITKVGETTQENLYTRYQGLDGAFIGGTVGAAISGWTGALAGMAAGSAASFITNAFIRDVYFSLEGELQVIERIKTTVTTEVVVKNEQGSGGTETHIYRKNDENEIPHRTGVVGWVNKVNLKAEQAIPALVNGVSLSVAGVL